MTTLSDYQPSPELWALLSIIVGGVGRFCYDPVKRKQDRLDREQFIFWSSTSGDPRPDAIAQPELE